MEPDDQTSGVPWGWWLGALVAVLAVVGVWIVVSLDRPSDVRAAGSGPGVVAGSAAPVSARPSTTPLATPGTGTAGPTSTPTGTPTGGSPRASATATTTQVVIGPQSGGPEADGPVVTLQGTLVALQRSGTGSPRNCLALDTGSAKVVLYQTSDAYSLVYAYATTGVLLPAKSGILSGSVAAGTDKLVAAVDTKVSLTGRRLTTVSDTSGCGVPGQFHFSAVG